jgi:hypothetical protein
VVYNDLEKHFEGRDAKDVLHHTVNLHRFTAQPKEFDIKEDIVRLDDLFREVDEVTGTPLSDIYKLSYFICHFQSNPRPGVNSRLYRMQLQRHVSRYLRSFCCRPYGVAWGSRDRWTKRGVLGKGASLDYNEGMTKLACLQRMVL